MGNVSQPAAATQQLMPRATARMDTAWHVDRLMKASLGLKASVNRVGCILKGWGSDTHAELCDKQWEADLRGVVDKVASASSATQGQFTVPPIFGVKVTDIKNERQVPAPYVPSVSSSSQALTTKPTYRPITQHPWHITTRATAIPTRAPTLSPTVHSTPLPTKLPASADDYKPPYANLVWDKTAQRFVLPSQASSASSQRE